MEEDTIRTNLGIKDVEERAGLFFFMIRKRYFSYKTSWDVHTNLVDYGQLTSATKYRQRRNKNNASDVVRLLTIPLSPATEVRSRFY
jgi:hypothetical protein